MSEQRNQGGDGQLAHPLLRAVALRHPAAQVDHRTLALPTFQVERRTWRVVLEPLLKERPSILLPLLVLLNRLLFQLLHKIVPSSHILVLTSQVAEWSLLGPLLHLLLMLLLPGLHLLLVILSHFLHPAFPRTERSLKIFHESHIFHHILRNTPDENNTSDSLHKNALIFCSGVSFHGSHLHNVKVGKGVGKADNF